MQKNIKILPIFLLLVHLTGLGIQLFHRHEHLDQVKKVIVSFTDPANSVHDDEDNCSICYFSSQHISCEPDNMSGFIIVEESVFFTNNYNSYLLNTPSDIPQRGPPQA